MKRKRIIEILVILCLPFGMNAQLVTKGVVRDAANNEPLAFAAVTIKGTTLGTSTDADGRYVFRVPDTYRSGVMVVSCVGYNMQTVNITTLKPNQEMNFALDAVVKNITEVSVSAKSRLPFTIVKTAIENIVSNYPSSPYNYDLAYIDERKAGSATRKQTASILFFDKAGYTRRDAMSVFSNCGYNIVSSKNNYTVRTIGDGATSIDELLQGDVVRNNLNILEDSRINDFDIKIEKITKIGNDSAWVLTFDNKRGGLLSSGDWGARAISGSLVIKMADYAILQYSATVKTRVLNEVSHQLAVDTAASASLFREVTYQLETTYQSRAGKYYLQRIRLTCPARNQVSTLSVEGIRTESVQMVVGREYLLKP